jgi:hypothetical protein
MGLLICHLPALFVNEKRKLEEDGGIWRLCTRR